MFFTFTYMTYQIQYWDGRTAEWRGCGQPPVHSEELARAVMRSLREQSHGYVEFRAIRTIATIAR